MSDLEMLKEIFEEYEFIMSSFNEDAITIKGLHETIKHFKHLLKTEYEKMGFEKKLEELDKQPLSYFEENSERIKTLIKVLKEKIVKEQRTIFEVSELRFKNAIKVWFDNNGKVKNKFYSTYEIFKNSLLWEIRLLKKLSLT